MIETTLKVFGFIGLILIVVIMGLGLVIQNLGNEVHNLDDTLFQSRLERMELQYYDLLIDCHDPDFVDLYDGEVNDICNNKLPRIYNEYRNLVKQANERQ